MADDSEDWFEELTEHEVVTPNARTQPRVFRQPILQVIGRNGGSAERSHVLREIERLFRSRLTKVDRSDTRSGVERWQKTVDFAVTELRAEGFLEPADISGGGFWTLTAKGRLASSRPD